MCQCVLSFSFHCLYLFVCTKIHLRPVQFARIRSSRRPLTATNSRVSHGDDGGREESEREGERGGGRPQCVAGAVLPVRRLHAAARSPRASRRVASLSAASQPAVVILLPTPRRCPSLAITHAHSPPAAPPLLASLSLSSSPPRLSLQPAAMSKSTERFSLYGDERKEMTEAEEAYQLHSTAMNPDFRLQPTIGQRQRRGRGGGRRKTGRRG